LGKQQPSNSHISRGWKILIPPKLLVFADDSEWILIGKKHCHWESLVSLMVLVLRHDRSEVEDSGLFYARRCHTFCVSSVTTKIADSNSAQKQGIQDWQCICQWLVKAL